MACAMKEKRKTMPTSADEVQKPRNLTIEQPKPASPHDSVPDTVQNKQEGAVAAATVPGTAAPSGKMEPSLEVCGPAFQCKTRLWGAPL